MYAGRDLVDTWLGVLRGRRCLLVVVVVVVVVVVGGVAPVRSAAVSSRAWPVVVAFVPVETPFPLAAVCPSRCPCIFFRSMNTPPKRNKAPTATTGIYRTPNE